MKITQRFWIVVGFFSIPSGAIHRPSFLALAMHTSLMHNPMHRARSANNATNRTRSAPVISQLPPPRAPANHMPAHAFQLSGPPPETAVIANDRPGGVGGELSLSTQSSCTSCISISRTSLVIPTIKGGAVCSVLVCMMQVRALVDCGCLQ
jgi:hypothetical protein